MTHQKIPPQQPQGKIKTRRTAGNIHHKLRENQPCCTVATSFGRIGSFVGSSGKPNFAYSFSIVVVPKCQAALTSSNFSFRLAKLVQQRQALSARHRLAIACGNSFHLSPMGGLFVARIAENHSRGIEGVQVAYLSFVSMGLLHCRDIGSANLDRIKRLPSRLAPRLALTISRSRTIAFAVP